MSSVDPMADVERVASDGLDHVFTHNAQEAVAEEPDKNDDDSGDLIVDTADRLTVAQTAVLLGFDQRSVVKLIKERKLCGKKVRATRSWVVELECVQAWLQKLGFGSGKTNAKDVFEGPEDHQVALPDRIEDSDSMRTLWYKLDIAGQQLRAASYRIGYLESQVELYKQQSALLPDLQAEAARASTAEREAEELRNKLSASQEELNSQRRPCWQRWFSCT